MPGWTVRATFGATTMTLLQQRDAARRQRRLELYAEVRERLRTALAELIPGCRVIVFGSLTRPGQFNPQSDVDLALPQAPTQWETNRLMWELMDRLGRRVDLVMLDRCRFRRKILREGELWIA